MATNPQPTINKIYKVTNFDLLRTRIQQGNMYLCTDTQLMWFDSTEIKRERFDYVAVLTLDDLQHNITPAYGKKYYCWENNSLWVWLNKWQSLYQDSTYPIAYMYNAIPTQANPQAINPLLDENPNQVIDNNGLLKDGSVVIRDLNRIIKGRMYIEEDNQNLTVSSFLGGGMRFLPNGKISSGSELYLGHTIINDDEIKDIATLRAELSILNNEIYVDYTEDSVAEKENIVPELIKSTHKYKVFHEGNLDTGLIKELTPELVYNKLKDKSLPSPLELNVSEISGKTIDDISLKGHIHSAKDISNFNIEAKNQAGIFISEVFNTMSTKGGITANYSTATKKLELSANDFTITLTGGVSGSARVKNLSDTTINVTVDPTEHRHLQYEKSISDIEQQLKDLDISSLSTYDKNTIDRMINDVKGTETPKAGKPLLVNNDLELDIVTSEAKKLDHDIILELKGDVIGQTKFTGSETKIEVNTELSVSGDTLKNTVTDVLNDHNFSTTIGNGIDTSFIVAHNLNSIDLIVQFRDCKTLEQVYVSNTILTTNAIQVDFDEVIDTNAIKVIIYKL